MSGSALFMLAGETWLVEGMSAESLGEWARPLQGGDPQQADVTVLVSCGPAEAARGGTESERTEGAYAVSGKRFRAEVSPDFGTVTVRGREDALPAALRAAVRLAAVLRCAGDGNGLALRASAVTWSGRASETSPARAFILTAGAADARKDATKDATKDAAKDAAKDVARAVASAPGAAVLAGEIVFARRHTDQSGNGREARWLASGLPWEAEGPDVTEAEGLDPAEAGRPVTAAALVRVTPGEAYSLRRLRRARAAAVALAPPPEALSVDPRWTMIATARLADELPVYAAVLPQGPEAAQAAAGLIEDVDRDAGAGTTPAG